MGKNIEYTQTASNLLAHWEAVDFRLEVLNLYVLSESDCLYGALIG